MIYVKGLRLSAALVVLLLGVACQASAGQAPAPAVTPAVPEASAPQSQAPVLTTPCGTAVPAPAALPPTGSGPVVWFLELCFDRQGNTPRVDTETYLYYIKLKGSQPSQGIWVPYTAGTVETMRTDFRLLWDTKFLDDLWMEAVDFTFSNGVVGKVIVYHMEERERVKIVTYEGSKQIDHTKIEEQLRERDISIRPDSQLDEGIIRRVEGVLRSMMAEKGFIDAQVSHKVTPVEGGPKLVNIAFTIAEGPKIKIRTLDLDGNKEISDRQLRRKMKENKPKGLFSIFTSSGVYKQDKFEEDVERITQYYLQKGYVRARIGQPDLKVLETSPDGKTRWVALRVPITEGPRYRVGEVGFDGNVVARTEVLRPLFKLKTGEWYSEKDVRDGLRKAQEIYGRGGYMEFFGYPDRKMSDDIEATESALTALVPSALMGPPEPVAKAAGPPIVDVTLRLTEGKQYFVNRISFTGNTTTRDKVIRRELQLLEGSVYDSEALKYSIKRLNQLGYFKPLEGNDKDMKVDKVPARDNAVDVTLKFEEQNRNQLTFGAGVSQYEGVFGQLGFQTSNFLGRGESLTASMQAGGRAQNYQLAFSEPFLFDRPITGGIDIYKRSLQYIGYYTQRSAGGNVTFGRALRGFNRVYLNYAFEKVRISDLNEALIDQSCLLSAAGCSIISSVGNLSQLTDTQREVVSRNPLLFDSLLIGQGGSRTISKVVPSFLHNTVDSPIFPTQGTRYTASVDVAMLGGNTQFLKPHLEGVWFFKHTSRTSIGGRVQFEYIKPVRHTTSLPIFERIFAGGETTVRGFDVRSIGPTVQNSQVVLGGNKSVVLNAEYLITIAGPVRLVLFYDTAQVRDIGQKFSWKEDLTELVPPSAPLLYDPNAVTALQDPNGPTQLTTTRVIGRTSAFKTSTGAEIRVFMPVLNVPFRLIYSWNPQRGNVLDNRLQSAKDVTFRFAVGTTF